GARSSAFHSTFQNRDLAVRVAPAVEYSVFPYAQSTRRELTLQYSLGVTRVEYLEETIFGKTEETLLGGALAANYDVKQRWGGVRTALEGSHYLHDPAKYRAEASGNLEIRLGRGVSLNLFGRAESIHDQLHIPKGELTPEQVLLRQKQQATSFRYYGSVGLGYSFGSIFNNVVNPRLADD
ncbi:MAG: hypothetical protein M3P24_09390, partial [Gemmatimonadota bacterium]|nr:hypothetical protein [Gemmatimonadota bacterium]